MPMFDFFFTGALTNNDVGFVSDQKIKDISVPILILHAKVRFQIVIQIDGMMISIFYSHRMTWSYRSS